MMKCNCSRYEKNINELNSCISYAWIHNREYTGEYFEYCPWCGNKLKEDNSEKSNEYIQGEFDLGEY